MRERVLRWLTWGSWEFGRGIDIDQDGAVDGSGFLFRLAPPQWLRAWARRHLPPPTKEEMLNRRQDISDILLASLIPNRGLGIFDIHPGVTGPEIVWTEDSLG